jgi:hypothetical protein
MAEAPAPVRTLRRLTAWIQRSEIPKAPGVDPFTMFRLYRISVLRDLLKSVADKPLITSDGWAANMELLLKAARFARRVENVDLAPRYDLRTRESRVRPLADAFSLFRFSRRARQLANPVGGVA